MFAPEPMRHVFVAVPLSDLDATLRAVALAGVLHPLDVHHVAPQPSPLQGYDVAGTLARLDTILRALSALERDLGVGATFDMGPLGPEPHTPGASSTAPQPFALEAAESRVRELTERADGFKVRLAQQADRASQLQGQLRTVQALEPLGVPLERLRALHYTQLTFGYLPARNLARLRESLASVACVVLPGGAFGPDTRLLVTVLCLRRDAALIDRALRSAQFEVLPLPAHLRGTPSEGVAQLESDLAGQRTEVAAIETDRAKCAAELQSELAQWRTAALWARLLVEARGRIGHSDRFAVLNGWVPARRVSLVEGRIRESARNRCVIRWREPAEVESVRRGHLRVPVELRNPRLIRPFEAMLQNYGLPRYGEIEPTPIVALGFLTMFGFMFGDVGQGLVLAGIGFALFRHAGRYRDFGLILLECGAFATAFGFLYGSIFGVEDWVPALWLRPLEQIDRLMASAVAFGIGLLSLGLTLNLLNAVRQRAWAGLWERNGVLAAWAYWSAVALAVRYYVAGAAAVTVGTALLWLAPPLALILLKAPVHNLRQAWRQRRVPPFGELLATVIEALVEVLDTIVSTISNTATFIRLAAFALSHAALFAAVFSIAHAIDVAGGLAGTVATATVLVLGNAIIIVLEGLIVAIQSVRLEYYEFFSRFFSGDGQPYRPLRFDAARSVGS